MCNSKVKASMLRHCKSKLFIVNLSQIWVWCGHLYRLGWLPPRCPGRRHAGCLLSKKEASIQIPIHGRFPHWTSKQHQGICVREIPPCSPGLQQKLMEKSSALVAASLRSKTEGERAVVNNTQRQRATEMGLSFSFFLFWQTPSLWCYNLNCLMTDVSHSVHTFHNCLQVVFTNTL